MASFVYKNGSAMIQWVNAQDKRGTMRLSGIDRRGAELVRLHVERLVGAAAAGNSPPMDTARWLATVGGKLHARLVKAGLTTPRQSAAEPAAELGKFIDRYIAGRTDLKPRSIANLRQVQKYLILHFGARQDLTIINRGDMRDWHRRLQKTLAPATVSLHVKRARQIFQDAVDRKLITENPVKGIKAGSQTNAERMAYVTHETIQNVIDACPDYEWRLIFALARYGGLRVPSETKALRWSDVRWDKARMLVRSPKTAGHQGKASRTVPLFPELLPYLLDAFEQATPGDDRVIALHRGENLRTAAERIITRAGVVAWPKLFQNLRSSRETDLADVYPIHVVCDWIGNSEAVARKHYLQVKEDHFAQASGKSAAQGAAATGGTERKSSTTPMQNPPVLAGDLQNSIPPRGGEQVTDLRVFLQGQEKALHGALHRLRSALPRIRRRDIRRIGLALAAARRQGGAA